MTRFQEWMEKRLRREHNRDDLAADPLQRFKTNRDLDISTDYEKDFNDLTKVVMSKYRSEFVRFLTQMINERGDRELKDLLSRLESDRSPHQNDAPPRHPSEDDEVVPSTADRGGMPEGGSDGGS